MIDQITVEIVRNAFNAIATDMNANLARSAFSPIIYEMKDCSVALLDHEHRILGQSPPRLRGLTSELFAPVVFDNGPLLNGNRRPLRAASPTPRYGPVAANDSAAADWARCLTLMLDQFGYGGAVYPLTSSTTNSLLRDADPALFYVLEFLSWGLGHYLDARITAATGFDALTHCLEAYCSSGDHPMADAIALGGLELCAKFLARAVEKGDDIEARGAMMKAAMMGAVAFQKGLGACHSLAHPLSSEKGMHHGLANALCLPAVVEHNESVIPERLDRVRRTLDDKAKSAKEAVAALRAKLGLPGGLAAEGVTKADIPKLADKAFEDACHRSNPKPVTRDDLARLYELSL